MLGGIGIGDVLALDSDEHVAYSAAIAERERARQWSNDTELLATCVDLLHALLLEVRRGVPTVAVKAQQKPGKYSPVERPEWLRPAQPSDVIVIHPRDLRTFLK